MEFPRCFKNMEVKHIAEQSLPDQPKQDIHTNILEESKFMTLIVCQANNQMDDLHPYDRIKLPLIKKCFAILRLDMAVAIC